MHVVLRNGQLSEEVEAGGFDVLGGAPSRQLRLVTPPKGRTSAVATSAKPGRERRREERAQRDSARREALTTRREAAKVKAEAARRQRSIERATRQADRLREQLRAVEAKIDRERNPS
jgi:erythromycin esterase-like protein